MKRGIAILVSCMLALLAWSKVYTPTTIPMVHLEDRTRYTCNPDGILSANAVNTIDSIFHALEQQTGIQTIVAVVGEIDPTDCFEFAHALFTAQGVGQQGKDNGLVILLSTEERCIQFVTGYGLEGSLRKIRGCAFYVFMHTLMTRSLPLELFTNKIGMPYPFHSLTGRTGQPKLLSLQSSYKFPSPSSL